MNDDEILKKLNEINSEIDRVRQMLLEALYELHLFTQEGQIAS